MLGFVDSEKYFCKHCDWIFFHFSVGSNLLLAKTWFLNVHLDILTTFTLMFFHLFIFYYYFRCFWSAKIKEKMPGVCMLWKYWKKQPSKVSMKEKFTISPIHSSILILFLKLRVKMFFWNMNECWKFYLLRIMFKIFCLENRPVTEIFACKIHLIKYIAYFY